jgi:hypothetical protein
MIEDLVQRRPNVENLVCVLCTRATRSRSVTTILSQTCSSYEQPYMFRWGTKPRSVRFPRL